MTTCVTVRLCPHKYDSLGEPKIRYLGNVAKGGALVVLEQHICRLQVPMHTVAAVQVVHAGSHIKQQRHHVRLHRMSECAANVQGARRREWCARM